MIDQACSTQSATLSAVPTPAPGEALSGYLRRLTLLNGLDSLHTLASIVGVFSFSPRALDEQWRRLADVAGVPEATFATLRLPHRTVKHAAVTDLHGLAVRSNQLSVARLKACPACVLEHKPILGEWQLHLVTACGIHDVQLVDVCTVCDRPIAHLDPCYLWHCPDCFTALADLPQKPAHTFERDFRQWVLEAAPNAPGDLASFDLISRLSVVERLGALAAAAASDGESDRKTTYPHGAVDLVDPQRPLADARLAVAGGIELLRDWPERYRSLVGGLQDLFPSVDKVPTLRRFGSKAGFIAMKPLFGLPKKPIDFVERERIAFITDHVGFTRAARPERRSSALFADLDDFALRARSPQSDYMSLTEAARILGGRQPVFLRSWVQAELLDLHRRDDDTHAIPRSSVLALLKKLKEFPADEGENGYLDVAKMPQPNGRSYSPADFYVDMVTGNIRTVVRYPDRSGLHALAVQADDVSRRQGSAWLAAQAIADGFPELRALRAAATAIWGYTVSIGIEEAKHMAVAGKVRTKRVGSATNYSARDLLLDLQGRPSQRPVFATSRILGSASGRHWREVVTDAPVMAGYEEMPFYGLSFQ